MQHRRIKILHQSATTARIPPVRPPDRPIRTFANRETDASYTLHTCLQAVMSLIYSDKNCLYVKNRSPDALWSYLVSLALRGGKDLGRCLVALVRKKILVLTGHSQRMPLVAVLRVQLLWALVLRR